MIAALMIALIAISGCTVTKVGDEGANDISGSTAKNVAEDIARDIGSADSGKEGGIISGAVSKVVKQAECLGASIKIVETGGRKEICFYGNTINIAYENNGDKPISYVDLYVKGEKSEVSTRLAGISEGAIVRQMVIYSESKYGKLEELRILPILNANGNEVACFEKTAEASEIGICS